MAFTNKKNGKNTFEVFLTEKAVSWLVQGRTTKLNMISFGFSDDEINYELASRPKNGTPFLNLPISGNLASLTGNEFGECTKILSSGLSGKLPTIKNESIENTFIKASKNYGFSVLKNLNDNICEINVTQ